ncbi:MAG: TIGR03862 family flavoprotein [Verrucomicrobiota bacterium]
MNLAIIGGGPAGLRAAEVAAKGGANVHLWDAKPSVGRKFLVAGKGGLNLTKAESKESFVRRYSHASKPISFWESLISDFDSEAIRTWASELGVETFVASTGRVYPKELRAAPLLRRWVSRLRSFEVQFSMRHRLIGMQRTHKFHLDFVHDGNIVTQVADAVVLALGGGSWPETGSDGKWTTLLKNLGVGVSDLIPANCGWECLWPTELLPFIEGKPLKALTVRAGDVSVQGELLVTKYGLEGGALYQLGPTLRTMEAPAISIDFRPHSSIEQLVSKMGPIQRNFLQEARQRWRLSDDVFALLSHFPLSSHFDSAEALAYRLKNFLIPLQKARPIEEAISSAGGVQLSELDDNLMLRSLPGVFVAGEMMDWEAPTGGYLLQGCFATGSRAGTSALNWLKSRASY